MDKKSDLIHSTLEGLAEISDLLKRLNDRRTAYLISQILVRLAIRLAKEL